VAAFPAVRRLGLVLAVIVLAALGAFAAIAFFNARDDAGVSTGASPASEAPGVPLGELGVTTPDTPAGNVVVLYSDPKQKVALDTLAEEIAGPPSSELEQAGQAVLVRRDQGVQGIVAVAGDRGVRVTDPADPSLRAFIEGNLGASGG
jgi:hypothetical protein